VPEDSARKSGDDGSKKRADGLSICFDKRRTSAGVECSHGAIKVKPLLDHEEKFQSGNSFEYRETLT
jgi:hypothetical protein